MTLSILETIKNFVHNLITDIDKVLEPGIQYLKNNVPAAAITLAEEVLTAAVTGTPWAALGATLIQQAEAKGITLAEEAAKAALNAAQNNLIAKSATPPIV